MALLLGHTSWPQGRALTFMHKQGGGGAQVRGSRWSWGPGNRCEWALGQVGGAMASRAVWSRALLWPDCVPPPRQDSWSLCSQDSPRRSSSR